MKPIDDVIMRSTIGGGVFVEVRVTRGDGNNLTAKQMGVLAKQIDLMRGWFEEDERDIAASLVKWGEAMQRHGTGDDG